MGTETSIGDGITGVGGDHASVDLPQSAASIGRDPDVDVAALRHPYEPSRFALALVGMAVPIAVAVFVLVSLGEATTLVVVIAAIGLALLLLWLFLQVWRVRLLGDAVLVSEETLPELQEIIDLACERLGYYRPLRVFVVDKMSSVLAADSSPITFTQYFGIRVLIAEGSSLGDLADEKDRQRLLFTIATYVGALKARYSRWWSPLFTAFTMTGLAAMAQLFINPYYRATVFSGDRIAYTACGDLDVSLETVYRAMVGKEVAPHLRAAGLTGQALSVRRKMLLRFAQLLRPTPHATNRYLELMAFISQAAPDEFETHRVALGAAGPEAGHVLASLSSRRSHDAAAVVGVVAAVIVLMLGLGAGLTARNSPLAQAIATAYGWSNTEEPSDDLVITPPPETGPVPTPEPTTTTPVDPRVVDLLDRAGADTSYTCAPRPVPTTGTLASVACESQASGPALVGLDAYGTGSAMRAAVRDYATGLAEGSCRSGEPALGTWTRADEEKGPLACFEDTNGRNVILWGSDDTGVLSYASDASMSLSDLFEWWTTTSIHPD